MIPSLLFTIFFAASGVCISEVVFHRKAFVDRLWLGLTCGLLLLTWLPSIFAFAIGFTRTAQLLSALLTATADAFCIVWILRRKKKGLSASYALKREYPTLLFVLPTVLLGAILLNTHILYPHTDGSLWVGQVTYGDLAMHLGFITSIAEQGTFPPQYSIFPGHALNYPFLCETSGASLYLLGAGPRAAYLFSALYAYLLVVLGVFRFLTLWLKKNRRVVLASVLFFFGGGFGFFYFFDLAKSGGILTELLGTAGQTVSQTLLDGFYQTPTNIPAIGLRWVNVIVDMLIPQRATLFGWAFLFPCLYLLHGFAFEKKHENVIPLGVFAGLLPLIHTHSFLALGVISAVYCLSDLIAVRFEKKRLLSWLLYAVIACAFAAPQLFCFTFRQAAESSLVRFHLNWGNETDSYLWFYIKNMGLLFLLMPFAFLLLSKRDRRIYAGVLFLWLIAEFVEFQPNNYDNNKLLFIWFAYTCAIDAKLLCHLSARIRKAYKKRKSSDRTIASLQTSTILLLAVFVVYFLCKLVKASDGSVMIPSGTAFTLFFFGGLLLTLSLFLLFHSIKAKQKPIGLIPVCAFLCVFFPVLITQWLKQYASSSYWFSTSVIFVLLLLALIGIMTLALQRIIRAKEPHEKCFAGGPVAHAIALYLVLFAMIASSVMTIIRECKSEYRVYTASELELSEQIKTVTEPDAVVLANSYHWNLITPLTGRSIVTGTGTFLFWHGIDTTQRSQDVDAMFEDPGSCEDLFLQYHVRYVLITNAERNHAKRQNYVIDEAYFRNNGTVVAENSAGILYRLP